MSKLNSLTGLFVYGSLLWPDRRIAVIGREVPSSPARLAGWRVRSGRYLYIVEDPHAAAMGLILAGLDDADFDVIDRYEEVPRLYTREQIDVTSENGAVVRAWVYMPTDAVKNIGT
jgi:gamma-glutamylcyclotransferase (GGCT)/AIG2-like uncharacterized protein YtfP